MAEVEKEEANTGAGRMALKLGLLRIASEEGCARTAKAPAANLRTGTLLKAEDTSIVNGSEAALVVRQGEGSWWGGKQ